MKWMTENFERHAFQKFIDIRQFYEDALSLLCFDVTSEENEVMSTSESSCEILDRTFEIIISDTSTLAECSQALQALQQLLASLVLSPESARQEALLDAFLLLQDGFEYNVVTRLLEWLRRTLMVNDREVVKEHPDLLCLSIATCFIIMQGMLLLHPPSRRLFAARSSLQSVLTVLELSRSSKSRSPLLASAATPTPSPVLLPPSPAPPTPNPSSTSTSSKGKATQKHEPQVTVSLAALDTLLCAMVDEPRNVRTLESVGGLGRIVKVLKDKMVAQVVRIKVIEILFYYLLPEEAEEQDPETLSPDSKRAGESVAKSSSVNGRALAEETGPTIRKPAMSGNPNLMRPDLLEAATHGLVPQTPVKAKLPSFYDTSRSRQSPIPETSNPSPYASTSVERSPTKSSSISTTPPFETTSIPRVRPTPALLFSSPTSVDTTHSSVTDRLLRRTSLSASMARSKSREDSPLRSSQLLPRRDHDQRGSNRPRSLYSSSPRRPRHEEDILRSPFGGNEPTSSMRESPFKPNVTALPRRISSQSRSSPNLTPSRASRIRETESINDQSTPSTQFTRRQPPPSPSKDSYSSPSTSTSTLGISGDGTIKQRGSTDLRITRTQQEKKDLLKLVMPNVDALESRFAAMGLRQSNPTMHF